MARWNFFSMSPPPRTRESVAAAEAVAARARKENRSFMVARWWWWWWWFRVEVYCWVKRLNEICERWTRADACLLGVLVKGAPIPIHHDGSWMFRSMDWETYRPANISVIVFPSTRRPNLCPFAVVFFATIGFDGDCGWTGPKLWNDATRFDKQTLESRSQTLNHR